MSLGAVSWHSCVTTTVARIAAMDARLLDIHPIYLLVSYCAKGVYATYFMTCVYGQGAQLALVRPTVIDRGFRSHIHPSRYVSLANSFWRRTCISEYIGSCSRSDCIQSRVVGRSQRGRAGRSGGGAVVEWAAGLSIAEEGRRGWERAGGVLVKWRFRFGRLRYELRVWVLEPWLSSATCWESGTNRREARR